MTGFLTHRRMIITHGFFICEPQRNHLRTSARNQNHKALIRRNLQNYNPVKHYITGIMSGTSLDGLDIAHCAFERRNDQWQYEILAAETIDYPEHWQEKLRGAPGLDAPTCHKLHMEYGHYIGTVVGHFLKKNQARRNELIASHGHTVFHQPHKGYTLQIGHGAAIAASARCDTVSDFRSMDVALGGQGAPLVPPGDRHLFPGYSFCLNLGGFSNISFEQEGQRVAFDICPFNFVINALVRKAKISPGQYKVQEKYAGQDGHLQYDPDGHIAKTGKTDPQLLKALNKLAYYQQTGPKSLGEEWVLQHIFPLMQQSNLTLPDMLRTWYHHAAFQISKAVKTDKPGKILTTGGGAHNTFFLECLRRQLPEYINVHVPDPQTTEFKEALIFAFLGLLCKQRKVNCLASVTGAKQDSIGGNMHYFSA